MPESEQITHTSLAIQIAEVKGSVDTMCSLLAERSKNHNDLKKSHEDLAKEVGDLKVKMGQFTIAAIAIWAVSLIAFEKWIDRSHPQKDSGAIMPPALVRGRG
ncbi:MAG: hypothetical protein LW834_06600 [Cyanobium sp. 49614_E6]|jgi:hypothetical protein|nr:hypothetical protein [Cyanobium sp. 49614_E6]